MHKVVVERPRWNPGPGKNRRHANLPDELLPKFEGIKRPHQCRKGLTDLLGPLKRWLQSNVGRPWNEVYSEACDVIKPDSVIRAHIKTHLLQFVERHTFMHNGRVSVLDTSRRGSGIVPLTDQRYGWSRFFVHPKSGLLSAIPQRSRKALRAERRAVRVKTLRWLDRNFALKQIRGVWFACQFRAISSEGPFKAYDHALGQQVGRSGLLQRDGQYLHCIAKRQLGRRELKRYGLRNADFAKAHPSIGSLPRRLKSALSSSRTLFAIKPKLRVPAFPSALVLNFNLKRKESHEACSPLPKPVALSQERKPSDPHQAGEVELQLPPGALRIETKIHNL